MSQNWWRCYQNWTVEDGFSSCVHRSDLQIWVTYLACSLYFGPWACPVCLGFPEAFQCTWPRMKVVQALPVACDVCVPNARGCGWQRAFAGSVSGLSVQQSLCHSCIPALCSLSCRGSSFHALNFGELYNLDLFVCSVTVWIVISGLFKTTDMFSEW